ncbi:hypothetical protein WSM22_07990 [Cytophagales bacterium WSM2-2]|nr:hypothetical protein WSM22_07990 [Cytophagales bacterium WSM2-2]
MLKISNCLIFISTFIFLSHDNADAQTEGETWAKIKTAGKGELRMLFYEQAALIEYNKTGQLQGLLVDIVSHFTDFVKKNYNVTLVLKYIQEEDNTKYFQVINSQSNLLGVANISITEERKLKYKFTPPYMPNIVQLITNVKSPTILTMDELTANLKGCNGYAIESAISQSLLEKMKKKNLPSCNIIIAETGLQMLEGVSKDPKGFGIVDFTELLTAKRKNLSVKSHPIQLEKTEDLGFVMSKKTDWDVIWKEFLTEDYRTSLEFRRSVAKYLGSIYLQKRLSKSSASVGGN